MQSLLQYLTVENVVLSIVAIACLAPCLLSFPVVHHDCRMSLLPGIKSGDLVLFDDPLASWRTPHLRLGQWAWRIYRSIQGYRVYVMIDSPKRHWPTWRSRCERPGGTKIVLRRVAKG